MQGTQLLQGRQSSECRGTRQRHGLQTFGTGVPGSGAAKGGQCRSEGRLADGSGCGCSGGSSVRISERGAVAQAVARSAHPSRLLLPRRELGPRTRAVRSPRRTGRDKRGASVGRREDHAARPSHAESGRVDAEAGQAHPRAAVPQQRDALHLAPLVALRRGAWPDLVRAMAPLDRWRWRRHTLSRIGACMGSPLLGDAFQGVAAASLSLGAPRSRNASLLMPLRVHPWDPP